MQTPSGLLWFEDPASVQQPEGQGRDAQSGSGLAPSTGFVLRGLSNLRMLLFPLCLLATDVVLTFRVGPLFTLKVDSPKWLSSIMNEMI